MRNIVGYGNFCTLLPRSSFSLICVLKEFEQMFISVLDVCNSMPKNEVALYSYGSIYFKFL